jgi:hypothetical protein
MPKTLQIEQGTDLDPALKDFLDRVIVPALLREYLADVAEKESVVESNTVSMSPCEATR